VGEGLGGVVHEALAGFGQAHRAGRALHEREAHLALQLGQALADGGLAERKTLRREREAAGLRNHAEQVHVRPEAVGLGRFHRVVSGFPVGLFRISNNEITGSA